MNDDNVYDPGFVRGVFDEMSKTYGMTNYITSFGFTKRWRRQCIELVDISPGMTVCDLMAGQGEVWCDVNDKLKNQGRIVALDFSLEMCLRAEKHKLNFPAIDVSIFQEDILENTLPSNSVDCVVSTFGLKTFSDEQKRVVMTQVKRVLKPSGVFSFLEISVPSNQALRVPYLWYLSCCIPFAGKACLGNPDNYRLLNMYTTRFQNCRRVQEISQEVGLKTDYKELFYGCASAIYGHKDA